MARTFDGKNEAIDVGADAIAADLAALFAACRFHIGIGYPGPLVDGDTAMFMPATLRGGEVRGYSWTLDDPSDAGSAEQVQFQIVNGSGAVLHTSPLLPNNSTGQSLVAPTNFTAFSLTDTNKLALKIVTGGTNASHLGVVLEVTPDELL